VWLLPPVTEFPSSSLQELTFHFFEIPGSSRKLEGLAVSIHAPGDPMALAFPFRAFRYSPARAPFERVLTQPYDKISPAMQEKYYAADPHNLIAVEKGRSDPTDTSQNSVYTRAAAALADWMRDGIVQQDRAPSFYAYSQEYTAPGTEGRRTRRGFVGAGQVEEYSSSWPAPIKPRRARRSSVPGAVYSWE